MLGYIDFVDKGQDTFVWMVKLESSAAKTRPDELGGDSERTAYNPGQIGFLLASKLGCFAIKDASQSNTRHRF